MRAPGEREMDLAGWLSWAAVALSAVALVLGFTEPKHGADLVLFWGIIGAWGVVIGASFGFSRAGDRLLARAARRELDRMRSLEAAKPRRKGERP
jgi:hypothetical protein